MVPDLLPPCFPLLGWTEPPFQGCWVRRGSWGPPQPYQPPTSETKSSGLPPPPPRSQEKSSKLKPEQGERNDKGKSGEHRSREQETGGKASELTNAQLLPIERKQEETHLQNSETKEGCHHQHYRNEEDF